MVSRVPTFKFLFRFRNIFVSDLPTTKSAVHYAYALTTYRREPAVQALLDRWDAVKLRVKVPIREFGDPSTPLEALVAGARALLKAGLEAEAWTVVDVIARRVASRTYRHLAVWGVAGGSHHEDVTRDIVHMTFESVLSTAPQNEFWECRFWTCFDRRVRTILRDFSHRRQSDEPMDAAADQVADAGVTAVDWTDNIAARDLLGRLPEPMRTAFYLKHYAGYKEESVDTEQTISTMLGVSGRSVRNYLKKAEQLLSEWREQGETGND